MIPEITLNTRACFMNGMSFLMRKNSMLVSVNVLGEPGALGGLDCPFMPVDVADRQPLELLASTEYQIHDRTRYGDGAEHRRQYPQAVDHGEAPDRSRAQ